MKYFDVKYKSPAGIIGTHVAVDAMSEEEAKQKSPLWLSFNTPWKPEEFEVLSVEISKTPPMPISENLESHFKGEAIK